MERDGMGGGFYGNSIKRVMVHGILEYLRRELLDIYNGLHPIMEDMQFIEQVCCKMYLDIPLIPNLCCGAWSSNPVTSEGMRWLGS